ncbi:MAG: UDP-N-acetylglucosamine 1-carboxyvinyltransferase, partial [Bacillota bacterium]
IDVRPEHLQSLIAILQKAGLPLEISGERVTLHSGGSFKAVKLLETEPYPGFPTDLQPPVVSLLTLARGVSTIVEHVFPERFHHVAELNKMGARISLQGNRIIIRGVARLSGGIVNATDLRAGAALVLAGLAARGETLVTGIRHIERGYEKIHKVMNQLGARIERVSLSVQEAP